MYCDGPVHTRLGELRPVRERHPVSSVAKLEPLVIDASIIPRIRRHHDDEEESRYHPRTCDRVELLLIEPVVMPEKVVAMRGGPRLDLDLGEWEVVVYLAEADDVEVDSCDVGSWFGNAEPGGGSEHLDKAFAVPPLVVVPVQDSLLPPIKPAPDEVRL
jgi:hypothetical protein